MRISHDIMRKASEWSDYECTLYIRTYKINLKYLYYDELFILSIS